MNGLDWEKLEDRRRDEQRRAEELGREQDAAREAEQRAYNAAHPPTVSGSAWWGDQTFTTRDLERERAGREQPKTDEKPRTLRERFRAMFI